MLSLILALIAFAQTGSSTIDYNQPPELQRCLGLNRAYVVDSTINPFYLRGDFDDNGTLDYAVAVISTIQKKSGILFCFQAARSAIFAAGNTTLNEDDFKFDAWYVEKLPNPGGQPRTQRDAIHIKWIESGSGVLSYQNGRFQWRRREE